MSRISPALTPPAAASSWWMAQAPATASRKTSSTWRRRARTASTSAATCATASRHAHRGQLIDRVLGLKLGADDYLTKPFEMMELLARIEALLRRARTLTASSADAYSFDTVEVDFRRAEVRRGNAPIDISALEVKLLRYLVEHRGTVLPATSSSKKCGATTPRR